LSLHKPRRLRPVSSNEDTLKIIKPRLDLTLLKALGHHGQHGCQPISLDAVDLLASCMAIDPTDLNSYSADAIQPADARTTVEVRDLSHLLGGSSLAHALSFFDALVLLDLAEYGAAVTDGL
jgi:hypothetical protein